MGTECEMKSRQAIESQPATETRRADPPVRPVARAQLPIWCTPEQHVWLRVPHSWRCQCGEMEIVDASA